MRSIYYIRVFDEGYSIFNAIFSKFSKLLDDSYLLIKEIEKKNYNTYP